MRTLALKVYMDQGRLQDAQAALLNAIDYDMTTRDPRALASNLNMLGMMYNAREDRETARVCLTRSNAPERQALSDELRLLRSQITAETPEVAAITGSELHVSHNNGTIDWPAVAGAQGRRRAEKSAAPTRRANRLRFQTESLPAGLVGRADRRYCDR